MRSGRDSVPNDRPNDRPDEVSAESAGASRPRVTLIGKPGCHLCDDARLVVARVADDTGVGWHELSITEDPDLAERYAEQIPVILVDGEQHDFWRVDEQRLRSALAGRKRWYRRRVG